MVMKSITSKIFLPFAVVLLCISACKKDFLERTPGVSLPEDKVFSTPTLAVQWADNAYKFLIDDYARFDDHRGASSQASDEAVSGNSNGSIRYFNQGLYHEHAANVASLNDIRDVWSREYEGIRVANQMLEKMDVVPWGTSDAQKALKNRVASEMHFLRAFFYFELIKRFGGVPLMKRVYGTEENIDFPRNTYQECVDYINADLDAAYNGLPITYDASNNGRATKGAVRALRSRVLLYAASKLNNESNDVSKWKLAADSTRKLIEANWYQLQGTYDDILNVAESPEYIMIKIRAPRVRTDNKIVDFAQSPGSGGIAGTMNPTQNHVNLYEMKATGLPITDAASGYNPQAPYAGRDPRLAANVLYNDRDWQGRKLQMWENSRDYNSTNPIYTATRYYCRKYWPEAYVGGQTGTAILNYVFFRYAEILLNYAEAQNEVLAAPDQSVFDAINSIRDRASVKMPLLVFGTINKEEMRKRIRNERAVELAFEDHRWYDIMRWKAGAEIVAQPVKGMNVVNNNGVFTYTQVVLPAQFQKVYLDYMHRYPIPRSEMYKSQNILIQNPGW